MKIVTDCANCLFNQKGFCRDQQKATPVGRVHSSCDYKVGRTAHIPDSRLGYTSILLLIGE